MLNGKILMKGNQAIAEAAVLAGCRHFFGYPITPQNEIPEYLSRRLPEVGGVFLQAESEVAAINMVYGAAGAGARVLTSSSSPGISLKMEGISYIAGARLPCVIVNMMRGGPGLGGIQPSQSDYFQATKGGGHGDYRLIVLAPASVQEAADLTFLSFDLADKYRCPVLILGDGTLGQMMEPVQFVQEFSAVQTAKPWATTGCKGRERNVINTLILDPYQLERHNQMLHEKYRQIEALETRVEEYQMTKANIVVVAFGLAARIAKSAIQAAREEGVKVGLIRPITLWPFPSESIQRSLKWAKCVLTVEMNMGQMIEDVKLAVGNRVPVAFYGRTGGVLPSAKELTEKILEIGRRFND